MTIDHDEVERVARALHVASCGETCAGQPSDRNRRDAAVAIEALAARRPATEAEEAVERVRALAEELDEDSANADPTSFVAKGWRDAARRIRAALAARRPATREL